MQATFALALIRHMLQFVGATMVTKGVADDATVQTVIGALMSIISVVWSQIDAKQKA